MQERSSSVTDQHDLSTPAFAHAPGVRDAVEVFDVRLPDVSGDSPFIAVHCAAVSASLLEIELFGLERGAFTDSIRARRGVFGQAEGGTLFLDEIGEMTPAMQAKLLRAIQERGIARVGGENRIPVHPSLVCATNRDLQALVYEGRVRADRTSYQRGCGLVTGAMKLGIGKEQLIALVKLVRLEMVSNVLGNAEPLLEILSSKT